MSNQQGCSSVLERVGQAIGGDDRGCSSIFVFSFYSNGFPLWCNVSIRFCCMTVLLMTIGQSRVHYQTNLVIYFCNFWAPGIIFGYTVLLLERWLELRPIRISINCHKIIRIKIRNVEAKKYGFKVLTYILIYSLVRVSAANSIGVYCHFGKFLQNV